MGSYLVSPTGRVVYAEDKDAGLYKSLGYRSQTTEEQASAGIARATEEYYTRPTAKIQTALEGAVSGATLGISDMIAGPDSETAKRAMYNPGTRMGAEIVGGIAGLKLPMGGGLA